MRLVLLLTIALSACAQRTQDLKVYDRTTPTNRLRIELDGTSGLTITDYDTPSNYTANLTASNFEWNYGLQTKVSLQPGNAIGSPILQMFGWNAGASAYYQTNFQAGVNTFRNQEISGDRVQSSLLESINLNSGSDAGLRRQAFSIDIGAACPNKSVLVWETYIRGADTQVAASSLIYPCSTTDSRNNFSFMGALNPMADNTWTLGTTALRWSNVYATNLTARGGQFGLTSGTGTDLGSFDIDGSGNGRIRIRNSGASVIGTFDVNGIDAATMKIGGTTAINGSREGIFTALTVTGTSTMRTINPETDNTYNLGSNSVRWATITALNLVSRNGVVRVESSSGSTTRAELGINYVAVYNSSGTQIFGADSAGVDTTGPYKVSGTSGITATVTFPCTGTVVFTGGIATSRTGTC